jgi:hypothetical protein
MLHNSAICIHKCGCVVYKNLDPDGITTGDPIRIQVKLERVMNDENLSKKKMDRI